MANLVLIRCMERLHLTVVDSGTNNMPLYEFKRFLFVKCKEVFSISLFSGLWNLVFLFSNLSLVFLMPFAYFFTESEGFAGSKKVSYLKFPHNTEKHSTKDLLQDESFVGHGVVEYFFVFVFFKGGNGTSLWSSCAALASGFAGAGHCVGCISPPPWQRSQEKPLRWVTCMILVSLNG